MGNWAGNFTHRFDIEVVGLARVVPLMTRDVIAFVIIYLAFSGGDILRRHEVQPFAGWLGGGETTGRV